MRTILSILSFLCILSVSAQTMSTEEYIRKYKDAAIQNMRLKKVPASITLAQGILESGNGNSKLATVANNHFGIKCHKGWAGETYYQDDDAPNECFRKYKTVLESYEDHADFLTGRERYQTLFDLTITDYKGWAKGLKEAGYATNPKYADQLISLIERFELYKYDQEALNNTVVVQNNTNNQQQQNTTGTTVITGNGSNISQYNVIYINGLKAVKVAGGQSKLTVATDFGLKVKQIEKYNELGTGDELYDGEIIFLEPVRSSAVKGSEYHIVREGETLYSIAHLYGMKTEALMKKNKMWYASVIKPGDSLYLRKNKK